MVFVFLVQLPSLRQTKKHDSAAETMNDQELLFFNVSSTIYLVI